jgi:hypothetical protein
LLEDDSGDRRYEVELMHGSTDESHLILTIEYWDIERRKWPGYDHTAVLIPEELAARFPNAISSFSGSIPIIAIQVNGLGFDGKPIPHFTKVLDSRATKNDGVRVEPTPKSFEENKQLISEMLQECARDYENG